jgi:hypothetical protein
MHITTYGSIVFAAMAAAGGALQAGQAAEPAREFAVVAGAPATVAGVQTLCIPAEQIGLLANAGKNALDSYTLRVAVLDSSGNFLPQTHIELVPDQADAIPLRVRCDADWLLLQVKPGQYTIRAEQSGQMRFATVDIPKSGHVRLALTLGDLLTASLAQ